MKRYVLLLLAIMTAGLLLAQNKHALLIGISEYTAEGKDTNETWENIHGANDVRLLTPTLERQGFTVDSLTDNKATASNIRKHFTQLISRVSPGDLVVVHFSGHGQPVEDGISQDHDEKDGMDESIIPADAPMVYTKGKYEGKNHIIDDELNKIFEKIRTKVGKTGFVYVFLDACHAGTMYRGLEDSIYIRGTKEVFGPNKMYYRRPSAKERTPQNFSLPRSSAMGDIFVIEACRADEFNREIRRRGTFYGPLSFYINKALQNHILDKDTIWIDKIRKDFEEDSSLAEDQNIVIETSIKQ